MAGTLFIICIPCESYEEVISSKHIINESKIKKFRENDEVNKHLGHVGSSSDEEFNNYYYQNQKVRSWTKLLCFLDHRKKILLLFQ